MRYAAKTMIPLGFLLSIATAMAVLSCKDRIGSVFAKMAEPFVIPSVTFTHKIGQHGFKMAACVDIQSANCKDGMCHRCCMMRLLPKGTFFCHSATPYRMCGKCACMLVGPDVS